MDGQWLRFMIKEIMKDIEPDETSKEELYNKIIHILQEGERI